MTASIPDYLFDIDYDVVDRDNATDYLVVEEAQCVDHAPDGTPIIETGAFIGNLFARYNKHTGHIYARVCGAMSSNEISRVFGDIIADDDNAEFTLVLADLDYGDVYNITAGLTCITNDSPIWTVEVLGYPGDGYSQIDDVVRRLIHFGIWKSEKNIAQPSAKGVV